MNEYDSPLNEKTFLFSAKFYAKILNKKIKGNVLDLGSHHNTFKQFIPRNAEYFCVNLDKTKSFIKECDLNKEPIPFNDNFFDVVIVTHVLEHLFFPEKVCKEIARVTKFNGIILFALPNEFGISNFLMNRQYGLLRKPLSIKKQKYMHHWIFNIDNTKEFLNQFFEVIEEHFFWAMHVSKAKFILRFFPRLCTDYIVLVKPKKAIKSKKEKNWGKTDKDGWTRWKW